MFLPAVVAGCVGVASTVVKVPVIRFRLAISYVVLLGVSIAVQVIRPLLALIPAVVGWAEAAVTRSADANTKLGGFLFAVIVSLFGVVVSIICCSGFIGAGIWHIIVVKKEVDFKASQLARESQTSVVPMTV